MKITYLIVLFVIFSSCKDDISDEKYRNENYVFYQEDGKTGRWQKINTTSELKYKKGSLTYFYNNGTIFGELEVIDSFPNRIEKFYDKNEKLVKTIWRKGDSIDKIHLENGYFKHSYSNKGVIIMEGLVENNLEQGIWNKYRSEDGSLRQIIEMKDGLEHGKRENYWPNGKIKNISYWKKGKQFGEAIMYFENGNIEEQNFIRNGKIHGLLKEYYNDGTIKFTGNYWNGELKDSCKTYYKNGKLRLLQIFDLDTTSMKKSGTQINYYPSGKVEAKIIYKNNVASLKRYYENGTLEEISTKVNNKHDGQVIVYHENGNKKLEGIASDGYFNGKFRFFDKSGNLEKTVIYNFGEPLDSIMH
ncbi:toxin-antitoxin system YwqK family antitoxin [Tenacibaculum amylolyticum]|uniref:toxin-antitoxin system YwqK family antitoxin n=1 Tax=Tenacibaculum amylolyticum TaxID=104269 RepID=UPI003892FFC9